VTCNRLNRIVEFVEPFKIVIGKKPVPELQPHQVLVETLVSAISAGTELLVYRGQWPRGMAVDSAIPSLSGEFFYPLSYGYSCVGRVIEAGSGVDSGWINRLVFSFNPHVSYFATTPDSLIPLPSWISPEQAAFLPNVETAVNLVMDGRPMLGERVVVIGQGVVGLLATAILARFPLACLIAVDMYPLRRECSKSMGASHAIDPKSPAAMQEFGRWLDLKGEFGGADLIFELSGNPDALNSAIDLSGFDGRIVVGSWYGSKKAEIDFGGAFHRNRLKLISSQVSTLNPDLTGRWSKNRRMDLAFEMLRKLNLKELITHRFNVSSADKAYEKIDQDSGNVLQALLTYEDMP
jgi:2-desacetyl-2-hydroxyethyl bacteriochlorophyllide A dehydrogenase